MNRKRKIIRNLLIIAWCILVFIHQHYLSPVKAHYDSEAAIHYGPSQIVHMRDYDKGKYILSRYDQWISLNRVDRVLGFLWSFGRSPHGHRVDDSEPIFYQWGASYTYYHLYGLVQDLDIKRIHLVLNEDIVLVQEGLYDGMFLFTWTAEEYDSFKFKTIEAYDAEGQLLYTKDY